MRLFIDNTGLHSAGRCLAGQAKGNGEVDVSGLLQLATQIVFSERIILSRFESQDVEQRSAFLRDLLVEKGLDENVIEISPIEEQEYAEACRIAANKLSEDLQYVERSIERKTKPLLKTSTPDFHPSFKLHDRLINKLLTDRNADEKRKEFLETALSYKAGGGTVYMLAASEELWQAVRAIWPKSGFSSEEISLLDVYMRYYLNEELASFKSVDKQSPRVDYSPAISRARLVDKQRRSILKWLSKDMFEQITTRLIPKPIGTPSVAGVLTDESKGDPFGVIEGAIEYRAKAAPLRKHLVKLFRDPRKDNLDTWKAIGELAALLEKDLGLKKIGSRDSITYQPLGLVPLNFNVGNLIDLIEFKLKRKRVVVLSEFARKAAYQRLEKFAYEKLLEASCSKYIERK